MSTKPDYALLTDSTTDMPPSYFQDLDIGVVRLRYTIENVTREDDSWQSLGADEFYGKIRAGEHSTTTQVNVSEYTDFFKMYLDEGRDILYLAFSSGLSGSCNASRIAAQELSEQYPDRRIVIVDTLCASMGEGLLVDYVARLYKSGASLDETAAWAEENKLRVCHIFTVDDLNHLFRGGRVSRTAALLGTFMGIKPLMHVDNEGKLIPIGKIRGRRQVIEAMVEKMRDTAVNPAAQRVFISHGSCPEDAEYLRELIKERLGVKDFLINPIGPVIGSHSGFGTLALFYLGAGR